jgi:hypothetical protein
MSTYRVLRKFTRMPWHKKKEKRDNAWKVARGVPKDEKKCCNGQHHTPGYDKWTKYYDKRKRRQFERRTFSSGRWDMFEQVVEDHRHEDKWNWD